MVRSNATNGTIEKAQDKAITGVATVYEMHAGKLASLGSSNEWHMCPEHDDRETVAVADRLVLSGYDFLRNLLRI